MSNPYFQFKQFTVYQQRCAMKVCTDACLFGAWVADKIGTESTSVKHVLDIGTGTGLLSLMLAQKSEALIHAVESDDGACEQAKENFENSRWTKNLITYCADVNHFPFSQAYDGIICNPPFFEASLKSDDSKKNAAKHTGGLTFTDLISIVAGHLAPGGTCYVLLSFSSFTVFNNIANREALYAKEILHVKQTPNHPVFRTMGSFCRTKKEVIRGELSIKQENGTYSDEFIALLKDYYLYL